MEEKHTLAYNRVALAAELKIYCKGTRAEQDGQFGGYCSDAEGTRVARVSESDRGSEKSSAAG